MSTETNDASKLWIVERNALVEGAAQATRRTLASTGVLRHARPRERLFRHADPTGARSSARAT